MVVKSYKHMNKTITYVLLPWAILIIFIITGSIFFFSNREKTNNTQQIISVPSYSPTSFPLQQPTLSNNHQLSGNDISVKQRILNSINRQATTLYKSPNIQVMYIPATDSFTGQISTDNVEQAEQEAISWFTRQGISLSGVCNLPITFFLDWNIIEEFRSKNMQFNPLPKNC